MARGKGKQTLANMIDEEDKCIKGKRNIKDTCDYKYLLHNTIIATSSVMVDRNVLGDFRRIPYDSGTFDIVVFDPPHLLKVGEKSWLAKKYGKLNQSTWKDDLKQGFSECFRVLKLNGILVFKWNETDIPVSEILKLTEQSPLIGHKSGKLNKTHWILFFKAGEQE